MSLLSADGDRQWRSLAVRRRPGGSGGGDLPEFERWWVPHSWGRRAQGGPAGHLHAGNRTRHDSGRISPPCLTLPRGGRFVLEALKQNGVSVVIMTGDNQYVTQKVVRDVGLVSDRIVTETRSTRWTMPPWPTRRRRGHRCPRVSGAKEPGHPRSEGARARRWVGGRRHQRHSFATYR